MPYSSYPTDPTLGIREFTPHFNTLESFLGFPPLIYDFTSAPNPDSMSTALNLPKTILLYLNYSIPPLHCLDELSPGPLNYFYV